MGPAVGFELTGEAALGGGRGAVVHYEFGGQEKAYVDFENVRTVPGEPRRLGLWVRGDASGHLLWATFRDAEGEYFRLPLGALGPGWRHYENALDGYSYSDGDGVVQYPVQFQSLIIDNEPDGTGGSGAIAVDDLTFEEGDELYGYRYERGGRTVDVLWAVGSPVGIGLQTASAQVVVVDWTGHVARVEADNGWFGVVLSESPLIVEHVDPERAAGG